MGFLEKLKLLFKERQPALDLITEIKGAKASYKTLAFWVTLVGTLGSVAAGLAGIVPTPYVLVATTVLAAFYNVLRGASKADVSGTKPVLQTTEFWMGVLSQISAAIISVQTGGINPQWLVTASTVVGMAMAAGQNLAAQQPTPPAGPAAQ